MCFTKLLRKTEDFKMYQHVYRSGERLYSLKHGREVIVKKVTAEELESMFDELLETFS